MNSVWISLLWKEWREHRWKALLLLAVTLMLMPAPWIRNTGGAYETASLMLISLLPVMSIILGAGIAASEQSQRTIGFLQSLPTPMRRPAIAKLLCALFIVWIPCVAFFAVMVFWDRQGMLGHHPVDLNSAVLAFGLAASSLLIWMAAAGVNLSDEVRAGAVGLLVILASWAVVALTVDRWLTGMPERMLLSVAPGGVGTFPQELAVRAHYQLHGVSPPPIWPLVAAAVVTHGILTVWYVTRFGRVVPGRSQALEAAPLVKSVSWLAPPRRRPWTAILWKQARDTLPLAALGGGAILSMAIALAAGLRRFYGEDVSGVDFAQMAGIIWMMTGFCVSLVAGIGLFLDDLRPALHAFWRSRPIDADEWFWVKFLPSLLMTVLTLAVPAVLVCGVALSIYGGTEGLTDEEREQFLRLFGFSLVAQTAVYCVAAMMMALIRRPVYAALATILAASGTTSSLNAFYETGGVSDAVVAAIAALVATAAAIASWMAVRHDWGWGP